MSDEKSFQYVKIMLPLFRAVVKFCSTNRLDTFYVESIVPKTNVWFSNLEDATAVQTAMQYDENMVYYPHKPVFSEVAETKRVMTSRNIHFIAYIGNCVTRNLFFPNFISFISH